MDFNFSIFSGPLPAAGDSVSGLGGVLQDVLEALGETDRWTVTLSSIWYGVTPHDHAARSQGWKLHLSATVLSAATVLARSLPVLLKSQSSFKFASTLEYVDLLNNRHTPRGHPGKFITIYPESDEEAVRLATALHEATAGLVGPLILSDRPYAPGSLVHYRYGAFLEERRLTNDGLYSWVIFDPDGNPVEDQRHGTFRPPTWVECPFPTATKISHQVTKDDNGGVRIGHRFLITVAIRHANKGGVYRGVDLTNSAEVVIKEARPHVATDSTGKDVRDLLRAEARALEKLGPLGLAPRLVQLFEQGQHVFLAQELVPGVPLRQWVVDEMRNGEWRLPVPGALEMAERVAGLMAQAHQASVILRDFNPTNIMVRPDGTLRLIDLELAVEVGEQGEVAIAAGTPGFSAPEQMAGAAPAIEADYFGLGTTLCFVIAGSIPVFLPEGPKVRLWRERMADWLTVRAETISLPDGVQELILGLMNDDPERRWTPTAALSALATTRQPLHSPGGGSNPVRPSTNVRLTEEQWQESVEGCTGYLLGTMNPTHDGQLWRATCYHGALDQCAVQVGAAGVLGVLTRCFELTGDQRLPAAISTAGHWIVGRLADDGNRFRSLYFGEAGIAWSLHEAGRVVGDELLAGHALKLASRLPVSAENPDLTHGSTGLGLTFLHFWLRTGNEAFLERAGQAADDLVATAIVEPTGASWGAPAEFDSRFAGGRFLGFSHGLAGVGQFLLAMGLATGRSDCLELAYRAGETLLANVSLTRGAAMWGTSPGDETTAPYWCHGSAGIGGFLTRLHRATGDDRFAKMASLSAQAVMDNSWRGVLGQCHGLAGNGDFLLDMAETADDQPYEAMANYLARVILASRAYRDGLMVFPDEQNELSASWAHGVAGILAFFLRLRCPSPRMWTVDTLVAGSQH